MTLKESDREIMTRHHLEKSEIALQSAAKLLDTDYDGAANRAYYSVFHAEKALLLTKGILGDSHKHVHSSLSKEFVKDGILPPDTYKKVQMVQKMRTVADYSSSAVLNQEEAQEAVATASEFLETAKRLVRCV